MRETRVVAISDIHGNLDFTVPECDVLAIAGDLCPVIGSHHPSRQRAWVENHFLPWCRKLLRAGTVREVVFTPGNHDFVFYRFPSLPAGTENIHLLIDHTVTVCGVTVHGSPWTTRFGDWAFMLDEEFLKDKYDAIPDGVNILITHGPAYGLCDAVTFNPDFHLGSHSLLEALRRATPRWNLFGHIHTGSHTPQTDPASGTVCVNVSLLDENYNVGFKPFEFSIFSEDAE